MPVGPRGYFSVVEPIIYDCIEGDMSGNTIDPQFITRQTSILDMINSISPADLVFLIPNLDSVFLILNVFSMSVIFYAIKRAHS